MKILPLCKKIKKKGPTETAVILASILYVCPVLELMECYGDEELKAHWVLEARNLSGRQDLPLQPSLTNSKTLTTEQCREQGGICTAA